MKVLAVSHRSGLHNVPNEVPDFLLNEEWAQRVHSQSLKRLNERGGLSIGELYCNMGRISALGFDFKDTQERVDFINKYIAKGEQQ